MNWMHFATAVVAAVIAGSLSDWLFMGVLFHARYKDHPEVWRSSITGSGESKAILAATLLSVITCGGFVYLCIAVDCVTLVRACMLAVCIWLVAPLPLLVTNGFFIKFHPLVIVSQALGWLAKLLVCAACVGYLL